MRRPLPSPLRCLRSGRVQAPIARRRRSRARQRARENYPGFRRPCALLPVVRVAVGGARRLRAAAAAAVARHAWCEARDADAHVAIAPCGRVAQSHRVPRPNGRRTIRSASANGTCACRPLHSRRLSCAWAGCVITTATPRRRRRIIITPLSSPK
jgi:hypothetical protein